VKKASGIRRGKAVRSVGGHGRAYDRRRRRFLQLEQQEDNDNYRGDRYDPHRESAPAHPEYHEHLFFLEAGYAVLLQFRAVDEVFNGSGHGNDYLGDAEFAPSGSGEIDHVQVIGNIFFINRLTLLIYQVIQPRPVVLSVSLDRSEEGAFLQRSQIRAGDQCGNGIVLLVLFHAFQYRNGLPGPGIGFFHRLPERFFNLFRGNQAPEAGCVDYVGNLAGTVPVHLQFHGNAPGKQGCHKKGCQYDKQFLRLFHGHILLK